MRSERGSMALSRIARQLEEVALDVACGSGSLTLELAPTVKHITGIDLTPAMIDQARAEQTKRGIHNVDWRVGDVYNLPFAPDSFSLVTSRAAFHHLVRPRDVLREMGRVCAPGGRIVIIDTTFPADKGAAFDALEKMRDPSHVHSLAPEELRGLAADSGLREQIAQPMEEAQLPFEAVLGTSFPTEHSVDEIRQLVRDDAESGNDRYGLQARLQDGMVYVTYPNTIVIWTKPA
jgi:ubiquinone/menaquinone biosynthesis C-methylase UbiE